MVSAFTSPVDIANRALQHVGSPRIASFLDNSKQASESNFVYDKLRRAELRRAIWRFATRRVPLRAITSTSMLLNPLTWLVGTTYAAMAIVQDASGALWQSLVAANVGNTPGEPSAFWTAYHGPIAADVWATGTTYYIGDIVYKTAGNTIYISTTNSQSANDPASGAPWLSLGAATTQTLTQFNLLGFGQRTADTAKTIYRLPYGFLRMASQDLKSAASPMLATSGGIRYTDWELQGNYLFSTTSTSPILFRCVMDFANVPEFDDLFCEGLAARMGMDLCEPLTQSDAKVKTIAEKYSRYISEARKVNAIELGSTEDEEMDYDANTEVLASSNHAGVARQQQGQ